MNTTTMAKCCCWTNVGIIWAPLTRVYTTVNLNTLLNDQNAQPSSILFPIHQWLFCFPQSKAFEEFPQPTCLTQSICPFVDGWKLFRPISANRQYNYYSHVAHLYFLRSQFHSLQAHPLRLHKFNFSFHKTVNLLFLLGFPSRTYVLHSLNSRILVFPRRPSSRTQLELTTSIDGHFNSSSIPPPSTNNECCKTAHLQKLYRRLHSISNE